MNILLSLLAICFSADARMHFNAPLRSFGGWAERSNRFHIFYSYENIPGVMTQTSMDLVTWTAEEKISSEVGAAGGVLIDDGTLTGVPDSFLVLLSTDTGIRFLHGVARGLLIDYTLLEHTVGQTGHGRASFFQYAQDLYIFTVDSMGARLYRMGANLSEWIDLGTPFESFSVPVHVEATAMAGNLFFVQTGDADKLVFAEYMNFDGRTFTSTGQAIPLDADITSAPLVPLYRNTGVDNSHAVSALLANSYADGLNFFEQITHSSPQDFKRFVNPSFLGQMSCMSKEYSIELGADEKFVIPQDLFNFHIRGTVDLHNTAGYSTITLGHPSGDISIQISGNSVEVHLPDSLILGVPVPESWFVFSDPLTFDLYVEQNLIRFDPPSASSLSVLHAGSHSQFSRIAASASRGASLDIVVTELVDFATNVCKYTTTSTTSTRTTTTPPNNAESSEMMMSSGYSTIWDESTHSTSAAWGLLPALMVCMPWLW